MHASEILTLFIGILSIFLYALSTYFIQRQTVAMEEANRIASGSAPATADRKVKGYGWPILALSILLLLNLGVTAFNRFGWMLEPDPRYFGLSDPKAYGAVSDALSKITDGNLVAIGCYKEMSERDPLETPSCKVAIKLRQLVADAGWPTPAIAPENYTSGLYIQTALNSTAPARATTLLRELEKRGLHVGWINNKGFAAGQFALFVGLDRRDL